MRKAFPDKQDLSLQQEKKLPVILVVVYSFILIAPPALFPFDLRWYMLAGLAVVVLVLHRNPVSARKYSIFLLFFILSFLGGLLSFLRAFDYENHLYLFAGSMIGMLSYYVMLPVFSQKIARKWLLMVVLLAAVFWVWQVREQMTSLRYLDTAYYLAGFGNDKNYIAMILGMALISIVSLLLLSDWRMSGFRAWVFRLFLLTGAAIFLYYLFFTYSRSGLIAFWLSVLAVLSLYALKKGGGIRAVLVIILIGILAYNVVPYMMNLAPQWQGYFSEDRLGARLPLLQKSLAIIADNPLLGIGLDGTKDTYLTFSGYFQRGLPHNLYLKTWAELGLFGLLGYVIWIIDFVKFLKAKFWLLDGIDRAWIMMITLVFVMMFFLDSGGVLLFALAIYSGISSNYPLGEVSQNAPRVLLSRSRRF